MEGSPYRKFSISWRKGGDPGTGPGKLHSGEPGFLLAGIQRPVSCLGSGGTQYLRHRSSNPAIQGSTQVGTVFRTRGMISFPYVRPGFDDVLETVEPGALMFPEEELA
ncbi:hypothetical protein DY000_02014977 [Brassica cretica]|uniref:Uncharacterized protein n=1 Tax=Brassica cretica TaxID=69181 RepID=A0ABQ7CY75_BRACR|nr:hypothetical protein DY000_02014977 [Brassica cretica]